MQILRIYSYNYYFIQSIIKNTIRQIYYPEKISVQLKIELYKKVDRIAMPKPTALKENKLTN